MVVQGRELSAGDIGQGLLPEHLDWGRTRLSEKLCRRWDWRNGRACPTSRRRRHAVPPPQGTSAGGPLGRLATRSGHRSRPFPRMARRTARLTGQGAGGRARLHAGPAAVLPLPERTRESMMTRADLTEAVSRALGIPRKESDTIVATILDSIVRALRCGGRVEIRRFGSFGTRQRWSRTGRSPKTGARVEVPVKRAPYLRPSMELMELVNSAPAAVIPPACGRSRSLLG